jgi:hypothetical protein
MSLRIGGGGEVEYGRSGQRDGDSVRDEGNCFRVRWMVVLVFLGSTFV